MDVEEFYCKCGKCKKTRGPNEALVQAFTKIEAHFGHDVVITSGHRCKSWNMKQGGAPNSFHVHALASDFWIPGIPLQEIYDWIDANIEICGLGIYNTHIHLDVRSYKARWDKRRH